MERSSAPDAEIVSLLEKVEKSGVKLWDTANVYVYMDLKRLLLLSSPIVCQEEVIGKALEKVGRNEITICTKTGIEFHVFPTLKVTVNGSPSFIRQQCEASLKRLGVESIDLFYLHRIDQDTPIEASMMEMKRLVQEGKVKYVGLSECSASTIRRAHKIHPLTAVQLEYSLWCRGIEKEVLPTCKELGIGLVAYSPLGRGFLGGVKTSDLDKKDWRQNQDRFKGEAGAKNTKMLQELEKIAEKKGVTTAQLALAWVEAQQDRCVGVVPIPGTTKEKNLMSNVTSLDIKLSKQDIADMEKAVPWEEVDGDRYSHDAAGMATFETEKNRELTPEEAKELGL